MRLKHIALTAAILLDSVGAATAATVTNDLNQHAGPGTRYTVIDTMPTGMQVNVLSCSRYWCRVAWEDTVGYASSSYLAGTSYAYALPPVYDYDPYYYGYVSGPV